MRHMANFDYTSYRINDLDLNTRIGNQNIFNKNLIAIGKINGRIGKSWKKHGLDLQIGRLEKKLCHIFLSVSIIMTLIYLPNFYDRY